MSNSRWSLSKFFRFYEPSQQYPRDATLGSDTIESQYDFGDFRMMRNILSLKEVGNYTITYNAFNPGLISYDLYGSTEYWMVLLYYNNIVDISELAPGKILTYPSKEDLEYSLFRSRNPKSNPVPSYTYNSDGKLEKV